MTIHELLAAAGLTANDELPIWDSEASGEPTRKITATQLVNAVKTIGSLIATSDLDATPISGSTKAVQSGGVYSAIAQSTANTNLNGTVTGYLPVKNTGCAIFSSGNASSAYNVMSQLVAGRCAPFIITNADAASLLTGGKLTSLIKGTLSRTGANGQFYDFIGGPGGGYNKMYSWRVTATSDADMSTQTVYEFTGTAI